jgi:hypothetical protein
MPGHKQGGVRCAQGRLCAVPHNNSANGKSLTSPFVRDLCATHTRKVGLVSVGLVAVGLARIPIPRTYLACWSRALIVIIIPIPFPHARVFLIDTQVHNRLGLCFFCSTHASHTKRNDVGLNRGGPLGRSGCCVHRLRKVWTWTWLLRECVLRRRPHAPGELHEHRWM